MTTISSVPKILRRWFLVHGIVDLLFAIPLLVVPLTMLEWFGFALENELVARLVGAALVAIGTSSLFKLNSGPAFYNDFLTFKIVWSLTVIFSILLSFVEGTAPASAWFLLGIFGVFSGAWIYYKLFLISKTTAAR